jgi:hypothetical protein
MLESATTDLGINVTGDKNIPDQINKSLSIN